MAELLFKDPREYIRFEFELRKARRPAYSMRAFARDLAVSPSSLNDFIKGRVGMSQDRIESLSQTLKWSEKRKEHFIDLVLAQFDKDDGVRRSSLMKVRSRLKEGSHGLSLDAFKVISDWYHLVIRELCDVQDGMTVQKISEDLQLAPSVCRSAVQRLMKLKLLHETVQGLKPTDSSSHFGDEAPSGAILEFHAQVLDLAQKALRDVSFDKRESHSLVFSIREQDREKMHQDLKNAILRIANKYAYAENRDAIEILTLQVFPVWSRKGQKS